MNRGQLPTNQYASGAPQLTSCNCYMCMCVEFVCYHATPRLFVENTVIYSSYGVFKGLSCGFHWKCFVQNFWHQMRIIAAFPASWQVVMSLYSIKLSVVYRRDSYGFFYILRAYKMAFPLPICWLLQVARMGTVIYNVTQCQTECWCYSYCPVASVTWYDHHWSRGGGGGGGGGPPCPPPPPLKKPARE